MKNRMNGLYKAAFIMLIVCVLLLVAGLLTAYEFHSKMFSAVFSGGAVLLAFVGIILTLKSKQSTKVKKSRKEKKLEKIMAEMNSIEGTRDDESEGQNVPPQISE